MEREVRFCTTTDGVRIAVASYWTAPSALRAAGMALTGERKARGRLPLSGRA